MVPSSFVPGAPPDSLPPSRWLVAFNLSAVALLFCILSGIRSHYIDRKSDVVVAFAWTSVDVPGRSRSRAADCCTSRFLFSRSFALFVFSTVSLCSWSLFSFFPFWSLPVRRSVSFACLVNAPQSRARRFFSVSRSFPPRVAPHLSRRSCYLRQQQLRCPAAGLPAACPAERRCLQRPGLLSCFLK